MVKDQIFEVFLLPATAKELEKRPKNVKKQIHVFLPNLKKPYLISSRNLKGVDNAYRIRIGDYRILYKVYTIELIVVIIKIARKHVYR